MPSRSKAVFPSSSSESEPREFGEFFTIDNAEKLRFFHHFLILRQMCWPFCRSYARNEPDHEKEAAKLGFDLTKQSKGEVAIHVDSGNGSRSVKGFVPSVSLGDLAIIDSTKRSADVIAESVSTCYQIPANRIRQLESDDPALYAKIIHNLFRINIGFLRDSTRELAALKASAN